MKAVKAIIEVCAGIVPGSPMPEYTKRWAYTNEDYRKDQRVPQDQPTIFSTRLEEAHKHDHYFTLDGHYDGWGRSMIGTNFDPLQAFQKALEIDKERDIEK